jgi:hypothetical protein
MIRDPQDELRARTEDQVQKLARQFREWLSRSMDQLELAYSDEGILALYTLLDMKGPEIADLGGEEAGRWVVGMSAFLGECIRARFGGHYFPSGDQGFGLRLPDHREVFPVRWIQGQLSEGKGNSVLVRYELLVCSLLEGPGEGSGAPPRPRR